MADIEKVIKEYESFVDKYECFCSSDDYVFEMHKAVLALLKEQQKEIVPYIDIDEAKCPDCKVKLTRQELLGEDVLFEDFYDYCPRCGRKVKWE